MADYTTILDDELLPDSPGTSILFFRLRDNPLAIAEGASGAPRLRIGALQRIWAGWVHRVTCENVTAAYGPGGGTGAARATSFVFVQAGSIRAIVWRSGAFGTCQLIRRRGRVDTVLQTPTGAGDSAAVDFDVLPGDALILALSISSGSGSGSLTCDVRLLTDGQDVIPVVGAAIYGNTYNA